MPPSTRHLLRLLFGIVILMATGCAVLPRSEPSGAGAGEPVTVTFLVSGGPAEQAAYQAVVDRFNTLYTEIHVEIIGVPRMSDFITRLTTDFAAGAPPDLFMLNYRRMAQFYNRGAIELLDPYLKAGSTLNEADFYPEALDAFRNAAGELICMPQNVSSQVVYFNQDLFDQAGLPYPKADWTWEEFRQTAITLTLPDENDDTYPDQYGLGLEPVLIRMAAFIWQNGGELVDDPANPTHLALNEPAAREAIQFVLDLAQKDGVVPNYSAEAVASHPDRFLAGNIAMYVDSRVFTPTLRETVTFRWDVAPLPRGKQVANVLHSDAYCMASASTVKDAAWVFVEFALSEEGQTIAARLGRTVPSMRKVAESEAFLDPAQPPASAHVWLDNMEQNMRAMPRLENWNAIERTAAIELEQAYLGFQSLEGLLAGIEATAAEGFVPIK
ncbi:MAG: sugar ABC transporter substrate-binding protein [Chloroflexi bacterium]|nr:MAG: sugar ABC transporter substrate-binding protein [Chloroflexota bacterium]